MIHNIVFILLDFIRGLNYNIIKAYSLVSCILLSSSGKNGGRGKNWYESGLSLAHPEGFCTLPHFYLMTKAECSFRNAVIL
jgi:hypothetical protein